MLKWDCKENEEIKQEVAYLSKTLYNKKGKAKQIQPHQDNTTTGVKELDEEKVVVCWLCHKEGRKSYQCKVSTDGERKRQQASSPTPIPTRWTKRTPHLTCSRR